VRALLIVAALAAAASPLSAQERLTGTHVSALPAVNYNSDEGFGYGIVAGIYGHGDGTRDPYRWAVEPLLFFTTGGHTTLRAFVDVPYLLRTLRLSALASLDHDCCSPYFGFGNDAPYDPSLVATTQGPNPYTYRRNRVTGSVTTQWRPGGSLRLLAGVTAHRNVADSRGPGTVFARDSAAAVFPASDAATTAVGVTVGVVYDSRDQERDPSRGIWADALVWQGLTALGSATSFTRVTGTARGYVPLTSWLRVAARVLGESVYGTMPVTMLGDIGTAFGDLQGFGGAGTIRGVLRNRLLDYHRALANVELRLRGSVFHFLHQQFRPGGVVFYDTGRVWSRGEAFSLRDLVWGVGGGGRLTWGEAFIIAGDVGYGREAGMQIYLDLGQMF
jgi:hypothetical protein